MIEQNSKAPDFLLKTDEEETITLNTLKGTNVILYFYPKDNTPGCTNEAKQFSSLINEFAKNNAIVIAVSGDDIETHRKFREKYDLKIKLGSDQTKEILHAYEVFVEKSMFGKKYMGIERSTFLIDTDNIIRQIWRKVKIRKHAEMVLDALTKIND